MDDSLAVVVTFPGDCLETSEWRTCHAVEGRFLGGLSASFLRVLSCFFFFWSSVRGFLTRFLAGFFAEAFFAGSALTLGFALGFLVALLLALGFVVVVFFAFSPVEASADSTTAFGFFLRGDVVVRPVWPFGLETGLVA